MQKEETSDREEETLEDLYNEERVFRESLLKVLEGMIQALNKICQMIETIGEK